MYGLIFENFSGYIKVGLCTHDIKIGKLSIQVKYGEEAWDNNNITIIIITITMITITITEQGIAG